MKRQNRGFTLIELLIVIGIIGFIAAAILVAVDPVKRIQDSRDTQRISETQGILDAILKKQVDDVAQFEGSGTAQVNTITVTAVDLFPYTVTINGDASPSAYTADASATQAEIIAGLIAAINADADALNEVTAGNPTATTFTVTSDIPGTAFTQVLSANLVNAATTANGAGAGIDSDNTTSQVVVSSISGVDCDTPASAPLCPDDGSLALSIADGTGCVVDLSGLVSTYLAEVPIDPLDGETPSVGNLAVGTNNTGYFLNRNAGGRLTIGACYGEQNNTIKTSR